MKTCVVNLAYLDPAQIGGVGRIAHEVSRLLATYAHETATTRVIFVVNWRFAGGFAQWLGQAAVVIPFISKHDLKLTLRFLKPDVVVSPLFGIEPFTAAQALHIVGMPDALALDHPELFSEADLAYRQQVYANLKLAFRVVTISEHARQRIQAHTNLPADHIRVVPLGAEPQVISQTTTFPNLPPRYVFYPAHFWPHKRHDLLMRIMKRVWQDDPSLHLVLTGGRSAEHQRRLQEWISTYQLPPERIHDLGYISDAQVSLVYQKAEALLFVSQYEGFGMPLLEAMLNSCPVICAPLAAIPEVGGDAALYVNTDQPDDWAQALLVNLPQQRTRLIEAGRKWVTQFTWRKTGEGWRDVLTEAGMDFSTSSSGQQGQYALRAEPMQPLLQSVSQVATWAAGSRGRQVLILPLLLWLQSRLWWMTRPSI